MELHYYFPTKEDAELDEFETYEIEWHPMADSPTEWIKKPPPSYCNFPSELPHVIEQQKKWFNVSNREDMIMLKREKEMFERFYQEQFEVISKHL